MKTILVMIALCVATASVDAKPVSNDMLSYNPPPKAWKKEVKAHHYTSYGILDQKKKTFCQIFMMTGDTSHGDITADFDHEWKEIIVKNYSVTDAPALTEAGMEDGWQAKAGVATFPYMGGTAMAMLTTITGYGRTVSIVALTNSEDYSSAIQSVLTSVKMTKRLPPPKEGASTAVSGTPKSEAKPQALQGYMDYSPFTKTWTWRLRTPPPSK